MTWTLNKTTGDVTAPWGEVVASFDKPYRLPGDVQDEAERLFRNESMASISTERIADYAQAWMGDIEVIE